MLEKLNNLQNKHDLLVGEVDKLTEKLDAINSAALQSNEVVTEMFHLFRDSLKKMEQQVSQVKRGNDRGQDKGSPPE